MALIDTARAMDDQRFRWRVMAALLMKAREEYAKTPTAATQANWNMANHVLLNPMSEDPTMFALVAIDSAVSEAVTVDADDTVDTSKVPDTDIIRVVNAMWAPVAKNKHAQASNPTPAA